jgi:hypothetical protein
VLPGCQRGANWNPRSGQSGIFCSESCRTRHEEGGEPRAIKDLTSQDRPRRFLFRDQIRRAIGASGKTLLAIEAGLAEQGHRVAAATLSTWQTGTSRPDFTSRGHLRVLALERFLDLEPGTLVQAWRAEHAALRKEPAAPTGSPPDDPPPWAATRSRPAASADARAALAERRNWLESAIAAAGGQASRTSLIVTYQEEIYHVGPDRLPLRSRITLVARALQPGIGSYWYPHSRHRDETSLIIVPAEHCRLGRTIREEAYRGGAVDSAEILAATELVFDGPIVPGHPHRFVFTVAHRYEPPPGTLPPRSFRRSVTTADCRTLVIGITFARTQVPRELIRCTWEEDRYEQPAAGLKIARPYDNLTLHNPKPGSYGWLWQWPAADQPAPPPYASLAAPAAPAQVIRHPRGHRSAS